MQKILAQIGSFCLVTIGIFIIAEIFALYAGFRYQYRRGLNDTLVFMIGGIPIAMPTVLSVILAVGATQLVKYKTIVTCITAIEELAGVTPNNHPTRGLALRSVDTMSQSVKKSHPSHLLLIEMGDRRHNLCALHEQVALSQQPAQIPNYRTLVLRSKPPGASHQEQGLLWRGNNRWPGVDVSIRIQKAGALVEGWSSDTLRLSVSQSTPVLFYLCISCLTQVSDLRAASPFAWAAGYRPTSQFLLAFVFDVGKGDFGLPTFASNDDCTVATAFYTRSQASAFSSRVAIYSSVYAHLLITDSLTALMTRTPTDSSRFFMNRPAPSSL